MKVFVWSLQKLQLKLVEATLWERSLSVLVCGNMKASWASSVGWPTDWCDDAMIMNDASCLSQLSQLSQWKLHRTSSSCSTENNVFSLFAQERVFTSFTRLYEIFGLYLISSLIRDDACCPDARRRSVYICTYEGRTLCSLHWPHSAPDAQPPTPPKP